MYYVLVLRIVFMTGNEHVSGLEARCPRPSRATIPPVIIPSHPHAHTPSYYSSTCTYPYVLVLVSVLCSVSSWVQAPETLGSIRGSSVGYPVRHSQDPTMRSAQGWIVGQDGSEMRSEIRTLFRDDRHGCYSPMNPLGHRVAIMVSPSQDLDPAFHSSTIILRICDSGQIPCMLLGALPPDPRT